MRESGAQEKGKQTAQAGHIAQSGRPPERPPLRDVLRLVDVQLAHSAATQQDAGDTLPDRRLLIFDVLGRRADGHLIRYRAMADTGSTGEFISPQAAKRPFVGTRPTCSECVNPKNPMPPSTVIPNTNIPRAFRPASSAADTQH